MKCWATLQGGVDYGYDPTVVEYPSLAAVMVEYEARKRRTYYPCWGAKREADHEYVGFIYLAPLPDNDSTDMYPDRVLVSGPRGGIRIDRA